MSDLISRENVIEALYEAIRTDLRSTFTDSMSLAIAMAENIPSVELKERKKGKWILVDSGTVNGRCSVCGYESHLYENDVYGEHYCPHCGADLG